MSDKLEEKIMLVVWSALTVIGYAVATVTPNETPIRVLAIAVMLVAGAMTISTICALAEEQ